MTSEKQDANENIQIVRGFPFPNSIWFSKKNIEDAIDYVPKDGDVIIASYPKTGTTWLQYIVLQITSKGTLFPTFDDVTYKVVPYIEITGVAAVEALNEPRIYKHHMPYSMVQKTNKSKTIYIYRNPEDTVVSYYHFIQNLHPEVPFNFEEFFDNFITGKISYGSYFEHFLSFYKHRSESNLLMVSYEKLQVNRREEILRIAQFLGEEHHACLVEQDDVLDKVIEHTSFEYMKKNLYLSHPASKKNVENEDGEVEERKVEFFRKGIVGDGKNVLTKEQQQKIKEVAVASLQGTSILQEWYGDSLKCFT